MIDWREKLESHRAKLGEETAKLLQVIDEGEELVEASVLVAVTVKEDGSQAVRVRFSLNPLQCATLYTDLLARALEEVASITVIIEDPRKADPRGD